MALLRSFEIPWNCLKSYKFWRILNVRFNFLWKLFCAYLFFWFLWLSPNNHFYSFLTYFWSMYVKNPLLRFSYLGMGVRLDRIMWISSSVFLKIQSSETEDQAVQSSVTWFSVMLNWQHHKFTQQKKNHKR